MSWNVRDSWPESSKEAVRRRVKELQTARKDEEKRRRQIESLRRRISELESEDENEET